MNIKNIEYGSTEYEKSIDLRNELFRKPQGLNLRDEDLSGDADMELYGLYDGDTLIGTVFLATKDEETAQVKSVTVHPDYQGRRLGVLLMDYIEDVARTRGFKKSFLMGRVSVRVVYEKLGYSVIGEPFDYHMTPHINMEKPL